MIDPAQQFVTIQLAVAGHALAPIVLNHRPLKIVEVKIDDSFQAALDAGFGRAEINSGARGNFRTEDNFRIIVVR